MNRRILAIVIAVLLAVVGTTAVLIYVNNADARALEGKEPVPVLVAEESIPAGTAAEAAKSLLRAEKMPAESVPSDVLGSIDADLADLVTSAPLAQGQLLTRSMLVERSVQESTALPKGKLAVTIPVEAGSQGDEQLSSGLHVAVFDTFTVEQGAGPGFIPSGEKLMFKKGNNHATRLLLPKVEVIDVVAEKPRNEESSASGFGKYLVTVAVSQQEAEKLIHALNTGTVSLAQVNDDSKVNPGVGVDNRNLFNKGA